MHEASLHRNNRFLTLTYDDEHLPDNSFLQLTDIQKWLKRLRKAANHKVRYLLSGEYGAHNKRPHYHAILFGHKYEDEKEAGKELYSSLTADTEWNKGQVRIGKLTGASANYVAQYTVKDTGWRPVTEDGELGPKPFLTMSRRPGIGIPWYEKFRTDLQNGYLVDGRTKGKIPRAYMKRLDLEEHDATRQGPQPAISSEEMEYQNYLAMQHATRPDTDRLRAAEVIHGARRSLTARLTL